MSARAEAIAGRVYPEDHHRHMKLAYADAYDRALDEVEDMLVRRDCFTQRTLDLLDEMRSDTESTGRGTL